MLPPMIEAWVLWVFLVGLVAGGVVTGLLLVRLPRAEHDVGATERPAEAAWIGAVIERGGGVAPASLVEEVLDLHQVYLRDARRAQMPVPFGAAAPAPPSPWRGGYGQPPVAPPGSSSSPYVPPGVPGSSIGPAGPSSGALGQRPGVPGGPTLSPPPPAPPPPPGR